MLPRSLLWNLPNHRAGSRSLGRKKKRGCFCGTQISPPAKYGGGTPAGEREIGAHTDIYSQGSTASTTSHTHTHTVYIHIYPYYYIYSWIATHTYSDRTSSDASVSGWTFEILFFFFLFFSGGDHGKG